MHRFAAIALLVGMWSLPAMSQPTQAEAERLSMIRTLQEAQEQNQGRVEISFRGPLPPDLIATIASTSRFRIEPGKAVAGAKAGLLVEALCGYRSERFAELLIAYNVGKFQPVVGGKAEQSTVIGGNSATVALNVPTCLVAPTVEARVLTQNDTAKTLAKDFHELANVNEDFCDMLLAVNARNVCAESAAKKLQVKDRIRGVSKKATEKFEARELDAIQTLRVGPGVDVEVLTDSLLRAAGGPNALVVSPQVNAELITPSQDGPCAERGRPPFDGKLLVDTLMRPILKVGDRNLFQRRNMYWDPYDNRQTVGIVDTGVFTAARQRLYRESGYDYFRGDGSGSFSKTVSSTGEAIGIEPTPTDGYATHGSHVLGLALGGAEFWKFLQKAKGNKSVFDNDNTAAYVFTYLPKIVFIKVTSLPAFQEAPAIGVDAMKGALGSMKPKVQIVNFSHKAAHSEAFKKFLRDFSDDKILFVSAAGNDFETAGSFDKWINSLKPPLAAGLTSNSELYFLTVGAADRDLLAPAKFSQRSSKVVDLFAPGVCMESLGGGDEGGEYISYSGTSQAAPLVTFALSLLKFLAVPSDEAKFRVLDTVDYAKGFEGHAISEGVLNIPKALDFFDDVVVFNDPKLGPYMRGQIVRVINNQEVKDARPCIVPKSDPNPAEETALRAARRIVFTGSGKAKIVPRVIGRYEYYECNPDLTLSFLLKTPDRAIPFTLAEVREIIPRPKWVTPPNP